MGTVSKGLTFISSEVPEEEEKEIGIEKNIQRNHDRTLPKFAKGHKFIYSVSSVNPKQEKHTKKSCADTLLSNC